MAGEEIEGDYGSEGKEVKLYEDLKKFICSSHVILSIIKI